MSGGSWWWPFADQEAAAIGNAVERAKRLDAVEEVVRKAASLRGELECLQLQARSGELVSTCKSAAGHAAWVEKILSGYLDRNPR